MNPTRAPSSIGILGGGTAGYLTALAVQRHLPDVEVEVIASRSIPPIGVGESTLFHIVPFLHDYLALDRVRFLREVRPTLKLGVRVEGWGPPDRPRYYLPTDRLHHEGAHRAHPRGLELEEASLLSVLMERGKTTLVPSRRAPGGHARVKERMHSYHFDNRSFITYLADALDRRGIAQVDAHITRVDRGPDGRVQRLVAEDGRAFEHDLWVDCSGFRSVLLDGVLDVPWRSYGTSHLNDRAILAAAPNGGRPGTATIATAMDSGWMWRTPMREEDHLGYVFSSAHCCPEEAARELERTTGVEPMDRVLSFPTGRHERAWEENVVAIGNAFAFIEPLQVSAIQMILRGIRHLVDVLQTADGGLGAEVRRRYNDVVNHKWDVLRSIIALQYATNGRRDTPYWRDATEVDLAGAEPLVEGFRHRGLLTLLDEGDPEVAATESFRSAAVLGLGEIDMILLGQGVRPGNEAFRQPSDEVGRFRRRQALWRRAAEIALSNADALDLLAVRPEVEMEWW